jgi:hypothetical protein
MSDESDTGRARRIARYTRDDRRFAAAAGFAAFVAACGLAWILLTFTRRPWFDAAYHVPVAFLFTGSVLDAWFMRRERRVRGFLFTAALAGAYTVGRVLHDWPFSGHGVLGALTGVAGPRRLWRVLGWAISAQALITKWAVDERPLHAVYGAALGILIGLVARRNDRAPRTPTAAA